MTSHSPARQVCGLLLLASLLCLCASAGAQKKTAPQAPPAKKAASRSTLNPIQQAARLNNLGAAYMSQQKMEKALSFFQQAHKLAPTLFAAELNTGIALLNLQRLGPASAALEEATHKQPNNARGWYNLGLLYRSSGQAEKAVQAFERVALLDPQDPDTRYFTGFLYTQLQQPEKAVPVLQKALELNPFHASAEFGLAKAYQRLGQVEKAREHLQRFQHLTREKLASPISPIYGEQGKYSLAEQSDLVSAVPAAIPERFLNVTVQAGLVQEAGASKEGGEPQRTLAAELGPGACYLDFDNDGRPDLYISGSDAAHPAVLYQNLGGRFQNVTQAASLSGVGPGLGCSAGDYDNDGFTDLAVTDAGAVRVFHNDGKGKFTDVTQKLGIKIAGDVAGLLFVDYDHDGDLDLYVTRIAKFVPESGRNVAGASAQPNGLWRNNGNGTFTDVAAETGLGVPNGLGALATDFNNDRAVDVVVTGWYLRAPVLLNPREGKFRPIDPWQKDVHSPTAGIVSLDLNKDGWMDLAITQLQPPGLSLWRNVNGEKLELVTLPAVNWLRGYGLAAFDYDNDGWIDLAAVGETENGAEIRLFRNRGPQGFQDVTARTGLDKIKLQHPRALLVGDYDGDGDNDLLITQNDGDPVLLRNDGGNRHHALRLAFKGLNDNKSAAGTKVEVYAGTMRQKWEVTTSSGYLSQNAPGLLVGLGDATEADIVRMLWPTGVVQDEIELSANQPHSIGEIDRRGSSCPVLFVWNGKEFEFVSDVIGPAVIGHWVAPGQTNIADPDEYIKVEGSRVKPRNGRLSFRFGEPMEEVNFIDHVKLLAVDHPADSEIYPNERFLSNPPFPDFKVIASRGARPPRAAWDDTGRNLLPELLRQDRHYVGGFQLLSFAGFAQPHTLNLDLGTLEAREPLRLLLYGFTEYFTANSMYAAHQANVDVVVPYMEALDASGKWVRIINDMGFPAGLPRMIVVDLTGKLPPGSHQIRIVTNLQVYWDQILVDSTPQDVPLRVREVPLADARLQFHGYPRQVQERATTDLTYHYDEVSQTGPFVRHAGAYTRYGDVRQLLRQSDDKFVVFGSGDEVAADFDAQALPAPPPGWKRDYLFYADGFVKDMDFYETDPLTVESLPFHGMAGYPYPAGASHIQGRAQLDYLLDYNTRFYSGNSAASYRFNYQQRKPD